MARLMCRLGEECYITPLPEYRSTKSGFTPSIFTHEQIDSIMKKSEKLRLYDRHMVCSMNVIPTLLRLLYSTRLRISEALSLRNEDVDFGERYIIIRKTKNGSHQLVYTYLQYEDVGHLSNWQQIMNIKALKTEKRNINYLTVDGIKLLFEQPDTTTMKGRRDLALLALMYDTGARIHEIADLIPDCVRMKSRPYTIRLTGKDRKSRIVPLMDEQVELLQGYMLEHHLHTPEKRLHPLFFNNRRKKLTSSGITFILHAYVTMARTVNPEIIPQTISCHSLRYSKAMHLLQSGVNLVYIKDVLGHSSIQTTNPKPKQILN